MGVLQDICDEINKPYERYMVRRFLVDKTVETKRYVIAEKNPAVDKTRSEDE